MPAALIVGAFGQDNPGDEALLESSVRAVQARRGWEAIAVTARPADTASRLGIATVPATGSAAARAARTADALVVGGGTVFKELHATSGRAPGALLRRAVGLTAAFRARRRPVAMIGVGADRIASSANRSLARSVARRADLLVLRDAESALLLAELGVPAPLRVGADLAWLTSTPPAASGLLAAVSPTAPVGVALSHLAGDDDLLDRLADGLRPLARSGRPVELEPWQGSPRLGADARLAARLRDRIGPGATVVPPPEDLADAVGRMSGRAAAVTLRFHAAVAAAEAGTPFVAVSHEPKLAAIARRTKQAAVAVDAAGATIAARLERALGGPPPSPEAVAAEHRRAEATADLLGLILAGDGDPRYLNHLDLVPDPVTA